jgi:hypothetical protein
VAALLVGEVVEALPDRDQLPDHELGDRHRGNARRIRDHDIRSERRAAKVIGPGTDRLHPAQGGRERSQAGGQVEGEQRLGTAKRFALRLGECRRTSAYLVGRSPAPRCPQTVLLHVRNDDHVHVGRDCLQPVDQMVRRLGRVRDVDDHASGRGISRALSVTVSHRKVARVMDTCP